VKKERVSYLHHLIHYLIPRVSNPISRLLDPASPKEKGILIGDPGACVGSSASNAFVSPAERIRSIIELGAPPLPRHPPQRVPPLDPHRQYYHRRHRRAHHHHLLAGPLRVPRHQMDDPHKALKDKVTVDSRCSRHMTGNKSHLADYQEFKGGSNAFRGSNGRITGKGKIKADRLDFEDVYYVEELKHYNLFSVSQMYDKKNKVLFTDIDCLVLSHDFKLPDENQILLKIPRQHNMYIFNLKNIDRSRDLACLFAKASIEISTKWHRMLGHVNFKNINKLVKGNLARGLPSKIFENDHSCVACQKGKQHKAFVSQDSELYESALTDFTYGFIWTYIFSLENQANKSAGPKEANNSADTQANDDQGENSKEINLHDEHFVLPIWSAYSTTVKSSSDKIEKTTDFKTSRKEATHENQNANTNNTNLLNAVSLPISTAGPSRALNDGGPSYLDDPSMPYLEDIYASLSERIFTDSSYYDEAVQTRSKVSKNFKAYALVSYIHKQ
nr:ribonuclease H-like domain-containing protein [Tanacetum cinerariifolium]